MSNALVLFIAFLAFPVLSEDLGNTEELKGPITKEVVVEKEIQKAENKNPRAISFEGLGRAGIYSVSYDHQITDRIALGIGLGFLRTPPIYVATIQAVMLPLYANYYLTNYRHRLFVTAGVTPGMVYARGDVLGRSLDRTLVSTVYGTLGAGYEFRGLSGILFRATPYLFITEIGPIPFLGSSLGWTF